MRPFATAVLLALSLVGACGRIGYTPLGSSGAGGAFVSGAGGTRPVNGGAGGGGGASQPAGGGGTSGSAGSGTGGGVAGGAAGTGSGGMSGTNGSGGAGSAGTGGSGMAGASGAGGSSGSGAGGANGTGGKASGSGGGAGGTGGDAGAVGRTGGAGGQVGGTGGGSGSSGASCPTDTFGGHTYAFCLGPVTWADARVDCAAKGMSLARIDDSDENAWVQSIAFAGISSVSSIYWSWIGATDAAVAKQWRWTDGTLFWVGGASGAAEGGLYSNWAGGSPSNGGTGSDCGILEHSGFWKDFDCNTLERYVCERY